MRLYPPPLSNVPQHVAATLTGGGGAAPAPAPSPGILRPNATADYLRTVGNVAPTAGWTALIYTTGITAIGAGARVALLDYGWGTGNRGCYLRLNTASTQVEFAIARAGTTASTAALVGYTGGIAVPRLWWARVTADGLTAEVGYDNPSVVTPGTAAIVGGVDTVADAPASYLVQDGDTSHSAAGTFAMVVLERYLTNAEIAAVTSLATTRAAGAAYPSDWALGLDVNAGVTTITSASEVTDPSGTHTWALQAGSARLSAAS